jgi:hypothetical protein
MTFTRFPTTHSPRLGALGMEVNLLKLGGLGRDPSLDVRQAALDRSRRERMQRAFDAQEARQRAKEREEALKITEEYARASQVVQENLLIEGRKNLKTVMSSTLAIAAFSLAAFSLTTVFRKRGKRSKSKRKRSSR